MPYGPFSLDPATMVLHYSQEIFEGLKAYRQPDGSIASFRPEANAARFRRSAGRLAMPELPEELFLESLRELVVADQAWVPTADEASLYLRPFMIATEVGLGVRPANRYAYCLIASPAGAYFSRGVAPVSVWWSTEYVRAAPGGTGAAKTGGNYAASLAAQAQAAEMGCDQVVWLDAVERRWVEEMGGMNLFFVFGSDADAEIVTPELSGSLLAGGDSRLAAPIGPRPRISDGGAANLDRRMGQGGRLGRTDRGIRVRDRGRHHPGGIGEARRRRIRHLGRPARGSDHATARRTDEAAARTAPGSARLDDPTRGRRLILDRRGWVCTGPAALRGMPWASAADDLAGLQA